MSRIVRDSPRFRYFVLASRKLCNCPGNLKNKVNGFLTPIEREGSVIISCLNDKCGICYRVPIISGIQVVIDRHNSYQ